MGPACSECGDRALHCTAAVNGSNQTGCWCVECRCSGAGRNTDPVLFADLQRSFGPAVSNSTGSCETLTFCESVCNAINHTVANNPAEINLPGTPGRTRPAPGVSSFICISAVAPNQAINTHPPQHTMLLRQTSPLLPHHQHRQRDLAAALHPTPTAAALPRPSPSSRAAPGPAQRQQHVVKARGDDEEPDWDKEMSIFKQRTMYVPEGSSAHPAASHQSSAADQCCTCCMACRTVGVLHCTCMQLLL